MLNIGNENRKEKMVEESKEGMVVQSQLSMMKFGSVQIEIQGTVEEPFVKC